MRVLILSNIPTPYNDALFAAVAAEPGIELTVAYCAERESNRSWVLPREKPYRHTFLAGWTLGTSVHVNPGIGRLLDDVRPEVAVVSGGYTVPTVQAAAWLLHHRGIPWVYWGEELSLDELRGPLTRLRGAMRAVLRRADGILAIGERAARSYIREGIDPGRIRIFHYYPDVDHFRLPDDEAAAARVKARREFGIDPDDIVLLFCGQLIPRKGLETLIEARARLGGGVRCSMVIVGDGPGGAGYREQVRAAGLSSQVHFAGFVQPDALPRLYAAGNALVLPSHREGWGLVVGEAMAAGLAVIASSEVNAARALVVPGENGFLFPPGDADALAAVLRAYCADGALRDRFRSRAIETAAQESPHVAAARLHRILAGHARPARVHRSARSHAAGVA